MDELFRQVDVFKGVGQSYEFHNAGTKVPKITVKKRINTQRSRQNGYNEECEKSFVDHFRSEMK